jgi:dTDP-4-dehydrorhamnose reductase
MSYGVLNIMQEINKDSKIIVTGVKGQLGFDCVRELKERGFSNVVGIDREELDITDEAAVHKFILEQKPSVVMHNAAWTAVDKAELMKFEVYKVNALGPKYIAKACSEVNAKMVYISTDYVFPGEGEKAYEVSDEAAPRSTYGLTKWQGEEFVREFCNKSFIVRISWVFGINGNNFVKTMLKLSDTHKELNVVNDQIGSPTYTYDLSKLLCDMIVTQKYGTYHATNEGMCSWADFSNEIFRLSGKNIKVNGVSTEEYLKMVPSQAARPLNSRMSKSSLSKAGFNLLPSWQDALKRYLKELERSK